MESIVEDISTLEVIVPSTSTTPSHLPVLLLCHGYGAGKAFYAASLQELSRHYRVLLIDWLGFGRSNRTGAFPPQNVEQTHEFFSESIERWRKAMDIDRFYLLGHSMGKISISITPSTSKSNYIEIPVDTVCIAIATISIITSTFLHYRRILVGSLCLEIPRARHSSVFGITCGFTRETHISMDTVMVCSDFRSLMGQRRDAIGVGAMVGPSF